jgi:alpha-maltose-1-phosphate synthase
LRSSGAKVSYTVCAHDKEISEREHNKLGLSFPYPHLIEPDLWSKYIKGYLDSDLIICPSEYSKKIVSMYADSRKVEIENKTQVIPHGVHIPIEIKSIPNTFTVGYLGVCGGPDKGLIYLLQAWKQLNYNNARLILAGSDSTSDWVIGLVRKFGGGNIHLAGWQNKVSNFYNNISLYVQPSASESFGCEILEAMAYGRPIICSNSAGGVDCLDKDTGITFNSCNVNELTKAIDYYKKNPKIMIDNGNAARIKSSNYTWDKIQKIYHEKWSKLLKS